MLLRSNSLFCNELQDFSHGKKPTYELRAPTELLQIAYRSRVDRLFKAWENKARPPARAANHHELNLNEKLAMSTRQCCRPRFFDRPRLTPHVAPRHRSRRLAGLARLGGNVLLDGPGGRLGHVLQLELEPGGPANRRYSASSSPSDPFAHRRTAGSGDTAQIANGGTANVTTSGPVCGALSIGTAAGNGTLQVLSGSLAISGSAYVGDSGAGGLVQSGGVVSVANSAALFVGYNSGSAGNYNLEWRPSGGRHAVDRLSRRGQLHANGRHQFRREPTRPRLGLAHAGELYIEQYRPVVRRQRMGRHERFDQLHAEWRHAQRGRLPLRQRRQLRPQRRALSVGADEYVGFGQSAVFNQSGGTHQVTSGGLNLGLNGTTGTYNLGGGMLVVSQLNPGSGQAVLQLQRRNPAGRRAVGDEHADDAGRQRGDAGHRRQ